MGYTLPREGMEFKDGEVRNVFLAQTMMNSKFEDEERRLLSLLRTVTPRNSSRDISLSRLFY